MTKPDGIDPNLWKIYQDAGQDPAGRGTGFADWQYWQGVGPSQYDRLAKDIAGTGTDQTTGTPWGAGAWQNSGRGAQMAPAPKAPANIQTAMPVARTIDPFTATMLQQYLSPEVLAQLQDFTPRKPDGTPVTLTRA